MFVWVELPEGIDTAQLVRTAIETEQVAFSPGIGLRDIELGIERLARVIDRALG
jgi:hypothetical protein